MSAATSIALEEAAAPRYALTDAGNAERFAARHRAHARYVGAWGAWYLYDGRRWLRDERGAVLLRAKEVARTIDREAMAAVDDERRKKIRAHASKSESRGGLENMVALARAELGAAPSDFDADPWLLNTPNGTIDLGTGELRPHDPADMLTRMTKAPCEPEATCPRWEGFLARVMAENAGMIEHLRRLVGYALVGVTSEHVLAFSFGGGANGKSVFHNTISSVLGDYATKAPRGLLYESKGERHPTELATLYRARFVLCPETKLGQRFDEGLVKDLVSDEPVSARRMREDFWTFDPSHTLFICGNAKPRIDGTDDGIWRRMLLIPWGVQIPPNERDRSLISKLEEEGPGILAWAVRGCLAWQTGGLARPPEVEAATAQYRKESDPLAEFLTACCELNPEARTARRLLRAAYEQHCREIGALPYGAKRFAEALRAHGIEDGGTTRLPGGIHPVEAWRGVRLRDGV